MTASKNKPAMTADERRHVGRIRLLPCSVCNSRGPVEAHEVHQGQWYTSIPLCADCHRGEHNGIHGQRRIWEVYKIDEWGALSITLRRLFALVESWRS